MGRPTGTVQPTAFNPGGQDLVDILNDPTSERPVLFFRDPNNINAWDYEVLP
ncbi:MAG: hypothetical protein FWG66_08840 [Spirochaetes bacterium]|nr:hypothetical protein [Spirochaetota bacterium]